MFSAQPTLTSMFSSLRVLFMAVLADILVLIFSSCITRVPWQIFGWGFFINGLMVTWTSWP